MNMLCCTFTTVFAIDGFHKMQFMKGNVMFLSYTISIQKLKMLRAVFFAGEHWFIIMKYEIALNGTLGHIM
jgi:hypothetical protein